MSYTENTSGFRGYVDRVSTLHLGGLSSIITLERKENYE